MADKRVAVILYGADRELWKGSSATLVVRDLNRDGMPVLKRQKLAHPTIDVRLENLAFDTGQVYGLTIDAKGHRSAPHLIRRSTFLRQEGDQIIERPDTILRLMLVPNRPKSSDLDGGYQRLLERGSPLAALYDETDYGRLEPAQQMALLNIEAKLGATRVGHDSLLSYVRVLRAVDPDRLFLSVRPDLKPLIQRSADFASAGGHGVPDDHQDFPACPDSWKHTRFEFANIQLSFSEHTEPWPSEASSQNFFALDTDIDLERGLGHVGEWLDNNVINPGKKTDQTLVYALLFAQGILPVFTLAQAK